MISAFLLASLVAVASSQTPQQEVPSINVTSFVVFSIQAGPQKVGDIVIGLFDNYVPKTATNFGQLSFGGVLKGIPDGCGKNRFFPCRANRTVAYVGSHIHRVVPGFVIQGGDITRGDGTGGYSQYGENFPDENFNLQHYGAGWVSMANSGKDTNNSQFFITLAPTPGLNGKHVVFGKVLKGMPLVRAIGKLRTNAQERPVIPIKIYRSTWQVLDKPILTQLAGADPNV